MSSAAERGTTSSEVRMEPVCGPPCAGQNQSAHRPDEPGSWGAARGAGHHRKSHGLIDAGVAFAAEFDQAQPAVIVGEPRHGTVVGTETHQTVVRGCGANRDIDRDEMTKDDAVLTQADQAVHELVAPAL